MKKQIVDFLKNEEGATTIEYALIASIIAIGILASLGEVRNAITGLCGRIVTARGGGE